MAEMQLPAIRIEVVRALEGDARPSFLEVQRFQLVARYPNGSTSEAFTYDIVRRRALDAVIIAAHHTKQGEVHVFLRSAVRPPLVLRDGPCDSPNMWELPAGLIEPNEAPRSAAVRELHEELGLSVPEAALEELGGWTYPVPGFCGERQLFFHVEVDPGARGIPLEDGSPLEREAAIFDVPLSFALDLARQGKLRDAKTELALRRLADIMVIRT